MGPGDLARALCGLSLPTSPQLIVGLEHADDGGVYKLSDDLALVQTVDFFTPIVDDPFDFGQIAVANALSDVYAMGGRPVTALNLVAFPVGKLDMEVLRQVLRGGIAKMEEAGVVLAGGHSISDPELKYGCAVTGLVHPDRVLTNRGVRAGDALVLTKPLGTGIVNTALKRERASDEAVAQVLGAMTALNRAAAEVLARFEVHACTDVTGFGLLGHALEMVEGSDVGLRLEAARVPMFRETLVYAEQGLKPGGLGRNRTYRAPLVDVGPGVGEATMDVLYDPQTSGGLLCALPAAAAPDAVAALREAGVWAASVVGRGVENPAGRIIVV